MGKLGSTSTGHQLQCGDDIFFKICLRSHIVKYSPLRACAKMYIAIISGTKIFMFKTIRVVNGYNWRAHLPLHAPHFLSLTSPSIFIPKFTANQSLRVWNGSRTHPAVIERSCTRVGNIGCVREPDDSPEMTSSAGYADGGTGGLGDGDPPVPPLRKQPSRIASGDASAGVQGIGGGARDAWPQAYTFRHTVRFARSTLPRQDVCRQRRLEVRREAVR